MANSRPQALGPRPQEGPGPRAQTPGPKPQGSGPTAQAPRPRARNVCFLCIEGQKWAIRSAFQGICGYRVGWVR